MNDVSLFMNDAEFSSALLDRETRLRREYIRAAGPSRASQARIITPQELLQDSAAFLELLIVAGAWFEAAEELGLRTVGEALSQEARLVSLTLAITGYDPRAVVAQNMHRFPPALAQRTPDAATPIGTGTFTPYADVAIATCPIVRLENLSVQIEQPALGHRCRRAFDSLVASTRRICLKRDHVGRVLGAAYHDGRLSVYEVAGAMSVPVQDAIAFLDEHGFARSIDGVRLDDSARRSALEAMRQDRIARGGALPANAEAVAVRNVIASQRIEDVDARRWLPPRS